jgi:hypothetical protein
MRSDHEPYHGFKFQRSASFAKASLAACSARGLVGYVSRLLSDLSLPLSVYIIWKRAIGRGLLAAFSPTECFQQIVQEHCLAFQDLKSRLGNAKPGRAIDFRK